TLDEMAPGLPAEARAAFDRVARTGEPTDGLEIDGPSGGRFRISVFRVTLPDGTPAGLGNLVLDVTEGHRLQQLQQENDTMRATAQLAHRLEEAQRIARLGSFEWRIDGDVIAWSREMRRIVGTEASPAGVEDALRHVHPADVPALQALYAQAADTAGPVAGDVRWVRPDGAVRETVLSFELVQDDAGEPTGMWGTIQDVTDLRAAERRARETSRELEVEHRMLTLIQRSMLPLALPPVPDAELAATYLAVTDRLDLGGDWYDALPIADGRFLVAVGDVAGHDLAAAMTMAQVRNALRAYAVARPDPGHVLAELNDFVLALDRSTLVTALVGVYDPVAATLRWACAGHDAPVVLGPTVDGEGWFRVLDRPAGMVLGVFPSPVPYAESEITLEPGETVLWYTDGLVDHPAMAPDASEADMAAELAERLRQLAGTDGGAGPLGVQEMIDRLAGQVLAERRQHDDICLLALRRGLTIVHPEAAATAVTAPVPASRLTDA
ncbi:MAG: SpoIIE family protein phosphatase, partial [Pseudonocardia sp.]|nr:SpoIIE family protein phosphatase [Pseudonocardia sp.]